VQAIQSTNWLGLVLSLLLPAGLVSADPPGSVGEMLGQQLKEGTALLAVYRDAQFIGHELLAAPAIDDDSPPQTMPPNSAILFQLPPGEHTVKLSFIDPRSRKVVRTAETTVSLTAGKKYLLKPVFHLKLVRFIVTWNLIPGENLDPGLKPELQSVRVLGVEMKLSPPANGASAPAPQDKTQ
jgi:hypothetical protein